MLNKFAFFLALIISPILSSAQISIHCGGISQKIPRFKIDSISDFNNRQLLVKFKIIPPLKKSKSPIELRILNYNGLSTNTLIIKCEGENILVDRYETFRDGSTKNSDTSFKNVGQISPGVNFFVKHISNLKLSPSETWDSFFNKLIANHFFELPLEKEINRIVLQNNPEAVSQTHDTAIFYEAKIGQLYRNVMYTNFFVSEAKKIKAVNYQLNIQHLLSKIY